MLALLCKYQPAPFHLPFHVLSNPRIIAATLPLERRPIFLTAYSGMYGLAAVAAPLIGGALTTHSTWRWCFYINLPIGGCAMLAIFFFCHIPDTPDRLQVPLTWRDKIYQMDLLGTCILIPSIVCLFLALQWGGSIHAWKSSVIISLMLLTGVGLISFISVQVWKKDLATVPPRIISQRSVACSACYVFLGSGSLVIFQYFVSNQPHSYVQFIVPTQTLTSPL